MTLSRRTIVMGALGSALLWATGGAASGRKHEVDIRNLVFDPGDLRVEVGDIIRFTNHDIAPHTASADDGSWDTGTLEQGQSAELTVTKDWSGDYFCAFHPSMTARLTIE